MTTVTGSVLITAGAGGAGLGIARAFVKAGARVAVCDVDAAAIEKANEEGILSVHADCSREAAVETLFKTAEAKNGAVEILVNNVVDAGEYERSLLRYSSLRTMVEPEDIAAMAIFLASDAGCRISGQAIGVDGNIERVE